MRIGLKGILIHLLFGRELTACNILSYDTMYVKFTFTLKVLLILFINSIVHTVDMEIRPLVKRLLPRG